MDSRKKVGVLLVNLGTPDAPTAPALKRYLAEFLSDPRVIEEPKWKWYPILHGIILQVRPKKSAAKYQTVWTDEGSPLLYITQHQANKVRELLPENYVVDIAMRYGEPSIDQGITKMIEAKVDEIVLFPLYPQYSAATTATVMDKVGEVLKEKRYFPAIRVMGAYYKNPLYIQACAERIRETLGDSFDTLDKIVFSYHGMPKATYDLGDPYFDQCMETTKLIAAELGESLDRFETVFQSRFGSAEWLQPYAAEYFNEAPKKGIKKIAVFCPGFSADCLETIEEMADENYEEFMNAGGDAYHFVPCLNEDPRHIEMMVDEILN